MIAKGELNDLVDRKAELGEQKRRMELQLSRINAGLKITKPRNQYLAEVKKQTHCKAQLQRIEAEIRPLKKQILNLWREKEDAEVNKPSLARRVVALRDHYLDFAKDPTRVNSMRIMAAQFADKLTELVS